MRGLIAYIFLAGGLIFVGTNFSSAWGQDLTSKKGETMLPEEGDYAVGFDADPFLEYVGNFLNGTIETSGRSGTINRPSATFLRTELGGTIISPYFLNFNRSRADFTGIDVKGVINNWANPFGLFSNDEWDFFYNYSRASSSFHSNFDMQSTSGNQLGILSPAGPDGPLGGGLFTAPGFGDVSGIHFSDNYKEEFYRIGIQNTFPLGTFGSWTPRFGYTYGKVEEESNLSAFTNLGTFNFEYHNLIDVDRHILEIGSEFRYKVTGDFGAYIDGDVRLIHNDASGLSRLTAGNFAPEIGHDKLSEKDLGGRVGVGLYVENKNVSANIGVEYETWQAPEIHVPGTRTAYLTFEHRESVAAKFKLNFHLLPAANPPEIPSENFDDPNIPPFAPIPISDEPTPSSDADDKPSQPVKQTAPPSTQETADGDTSGQGTTSPGINQKPNNPVAIPIGTPTKPQLVCGPDVTEKVHHAMEALYREWRNWGSIKRQVQCSKLWNPATALNAWDIDALSPDRAPRSEKDRKEDGGTVGSYQSYLNNRNWWFQKWSPHCAKPLTPCGPTVVFLGQCIHSQEVNYIQWGVMNTLCEHDTINWMVHGGRSVFNGVNRKTMDTQRLMSDLGSDLIGIITKRIKRGENPRLRTDGQTGFSSADPGVTRATQEMGLLQAGFKRKLATGKWRYFTGRPETACSMTCKMPANKLKEWQNKKFEAEWGGIQVGKK